MSFYLIAQIVIHDEDRYSIYESDFMNILPVYHGKLLSVDDNTKILEGNWPFSRTVLLEFPSECDAMSWYRSDEYRQLAKHRINASDGNLLLIKGLRPVTNRVNLER